MGFECSLAFVFRERERERGESWSDTPVDFDLCSSLVSFLLHFLVFLVFSGGCSHAEIYHLSDLLGQEAQPTLDFNLDGLRAY